MKTVKRTRKGMRTFLWILLTLAVLLTGCGVREAEAVREGTRR